MFYGVILCNTLVVFFAACGVANVVDCLGKIETSMGYSAFLRGLALAAWPLAVAGALFMLIQIACQVQQLVLEQRSLAFASSGKGQEVGKDRSDSGAARPETSSKPKSAGAPTPTECVAQVSAAASSALLHDRVAAKPAANYFDISDAVIPPAPEPAPSEKSQPVSQASAVAAAAPQIVAPSVPKLPDEERKTHFFSLD